MTYKQYRSLVFEDLKRFVPDIERLACSNV